MAVGDRLLGSAKARSFLEKGVSSEHFINRVIIGMRAFTIFKGVVAMVLPMMSPEQLSSARTFLMHKNLNVFGLVFETLATRLREDPAPLQIISYVLSLMGVSDPVYDELAVGHTIALIVDAIGTESGKQLMTLDKSVYGIRSLHGVLNSYPHGVVADIGRLAEEYPEDIPALLSVIGARSPDDVKRTLVVNDAQNIKKATTLIEDVIEPVIESAFRRVFGIELSGGQLGEIYSRLIGKFTMAELEAISSLNSEISVLFVLHRLGGVDVDGILKAEAEKGGSGSGGKGGVPPADDGFGGGKTKG